MRLVFLVNLAKEDEGYASAVRYKCLALMAELNFCLLFSFKAWTI
jgi:hypothetical protein